MRKTFYFVILLTLLSISSVSLIAQTQTISNKSRSITINILDAYYTDASGDGYSDDVIVDFRLDISDSPRSHFELYFDLMLPSTAIVSYGYIINTRLSILTGQLIFHNSATESGDYQIDISLILLSGGISSGSAQYIFDPPGEISGGDPHSVLIIK